MCCPHTASNDKLHFHWPSYFTNHRTKGRFLNKTTTYEQSAIMAFLCKPLLHFVYTHSVCGNLSTNAKYEDFKIETAVGCLLQIQTLANKPHQASLGKAIRITSVFLLEMKSPLLAANICIFLHLDYPCRIQ